MLPGFMSPSAAFSRAFSIDTYAGSNATQSISNGVKLASLGGLVWLKNYSGSPANGHHNLVDTFRGVNAPVFTDSDAAAPVQATLASIDASGFTLGAFGPNEAAKNYVAWSFLKRERLFDIVTYAGNGANRTIAHNLTVEPSMILVKRTDSIKDWAVYHRGILNTDYLVLNSIAAPVTDATMWNSSSADGSVLSLGANASVNAIGGTYVAYLFGHDANPDGLIQGGSFTTDNTGNATVTLGWRPMYLLFKDVTSAANWNILDTMRGWGAGIDPTLSPNLDSPEDASLDIGAPTSTGFTFNFASIPFRKYIYVAVRSQ